MPLSENRSGRVIYLCPPENIYQEAPAGVAAGDHAPWFSLEQLVYDYIPFEYIIPAPSHQTDTYAFNSGCGDDIDGLLDYTSRVVQPLDYADALSFWQDPWQGMLPDLDPWAISDINLIPADAWIYRIEWQLFHASNPALYKYAINEFNHDNTLLPQPSGDLAPDALIRTSEDGVFGYESEIVFPTAGTINARDALLQNFSLWMSLKFAGRYHGTRLSDGLIRAPFIVMDVQWLGIDTGAVAWFGDADCDLGMTVTGDIQRNRTLAGTIAGDMALDANVGLIANLSGGFYPLMTPVVDATNNEGGIDNGIDNTGYFFGDMALTAAALGDYKLDSDSDFEFSMSMTGDIDAIRELSGTLAFGTTYVAALQKLGNLWVEEDAVPMSMALAGVTDIVSIRPLAATIAMSMALSGDLTGQIQLSGTVPCGMIVASSVLNKDVSLSAEFNASMSGVGTINRRVNMSATFDGNLSFYSELFKVYGELAPSEQTVFQGKLCNVVKMGFRDNTIIMKKELT